MLQADMVCFYVLYDPVIPRHKGSNGSLVYLPLAIGEENTEIAFVNRADDHSRAEISVLNALTGRKLQDFFRHEILGWYNPT